LLILSAINHIGIFQIKLQRAEGPKDY
jgi:hypothetical protein